MTKENETQIFIHGLCFNIDQSNWICISPQLIIPMVEIGIYKNIIEYISE